MKAIKSMVILVNDQQEAVEFYTKKLGFEIQTDASFGEGNRWLTINLPGQENFEISLALANTENAKSKVGKQLDEENAIFGIKTDNIDQDIIHFKKEGVSVGELIDEPYGKFVMVKDLYGNTIYLHQEK